jgi:hypothetical protein
MELSRMNHDIVFVEDSGDLTWACYDPSKGKTSVDPGSNDGNFTTVMQWDRYKAREHDGIHYGMKSRSFEPYMDLPCCGNFKLEIALVSKSVPRERLQSSGWLLCDLLEVTRDLWTYQRYIQKSKAEFSVAKQGYVLTHSGWFSERSANYLASGRPVLVQETGFSDWMATGTGVIAFNNPDEAVAGLEQISRSYASNSEAAQALAREYFDSTKVLTSLIERALRVENREPPLTN